MRRKVTASMIVLAACLLSAAPAVHAAQLLYEGTLNDAEGRPVADGAHSFDFRLYSAETLGVQVWAEAHDSVTVASGAYSIVLGSRTPLVLPAGSYWLEVTVDGEVLDPRTKVMINDQDCTITGDLIVDGWVGVGVASPGFPLHIDQDNVASGFRTNYGSSCGNCYGEIYQAQADGLVINSNTGGSWAEIRFQNNGNTNMFLHSNGNLGIGTEAPDTKLEVWGDGRFGDWNQPATIQGAKLQVHNATGTGKSLLLTSFAFPSNTVFVVEGGGDVGIGIDNPSHLLDVGTSGAYCDGGAWVNGSSREYKENIAALSGEVALSVLQGLVPTSFNYTTDSDELYLGFIAEDVPDLVATKDRKGLVAMDIVAVLTKVVQEQQQQIQQLQSALEELRKP